MNRRSAFIILGLCSAVTTTSFVNCSQSRNTAVENPVFLDQAGLVNEAPGNPNPGSGTGKDSAIADVPGLLVRYTDIKITGQSVPTSDQKVKLLFVVDNSKSMRFVFQKLTASLNSLLNILSSYNVEVKVITTSEINKLRSGEVLESQGWSYASYSLAGKPTGEIAALLHASPDEVFGIYSYGEYHYLNNRNRMTFTMNDPQAASKIIQLKNMIMSLVEEGIGSNREQGLCNLLLALHDRGPNKFFEKNDTAGVVMISDENDQSFWNTLDTHENRVACRNSYIHGGLVNSVSNEKILTDSVSLNIYAAKYDVTYDYNNDGIIQKRSLINSGGIPLPKDKYSSLIEHLPVNGTLLCPQDFFTSKVVPYVKATTGAAKGVSNVAITNCRIVPTGTVFYNFAPNEKSICEGSFAKDGQSYANFELYLATVGNKILVTGTCQHRVSINPPSRTFNLFYLKGSEDPETLQDIIPNLALQKTSIKKSIYNQADRLFGPERFFIANLVHKDGQCILDPNEQSIGTDYMNLFAGTPLSSRSTSTSICENSFDTALTNLGGQIKESLDRAYTIPMDLSTEAVRSIKLLSGSQIIPLTSGVEYSVMGDGLTLNYRLDIHLGDILRVELVHLGGPMF